MRRIALIITSLAAAFVPPAGAQESRTVELRDLRDVPSEVLQATRAILAAPGTLHLDADRLVTVRDTIAHDVVMVGGLLTVEGTVRGNVVVISGSVLLRGAGRITGSVTAIGGGVTTQGSGDIDGTVRVFPTPVRLDRDGQRLVVRDESEDETWYRQRMTPRDPTGTELRLVTARTYNRVEGLPLLLGPRLRLGYDWGVVTLDAMGILRSADRFELQQENLGHQVSAEVRVGAPYGFRIGGRLDDVVDAAEDWQVSDPEVGIASFILHRDYRDYYRRHGGTLTLGAFLGNGLEADISWSDERWSARDARDPWSLLRDNQQWRANPELDAGRFHLLRLGAVYDTRNNRDDPWSGLFVSGTYEYGTGRITRYGPTSLGVRDINPSGRTTYDRVFLDVRRYNRVSAEGQLNFRIVAGGWLSGDELPLQRRFSLGSIGSLPGYDFRQIRPGTDFLTCSGVREDDAPGGPRSPPGVPAQCERFLLGQLEYRGEIGSRLFGFLDEERRARRFGWGRAAEWVAFADVGRGWLVGPRTGDLQYGSSSIPGLATFRADVGLGIRLDDLGLYVSKSVTDGQTPVNFFVRLRPRF
jgi:hypothetical protein